MIRSVLLILIPVLAGFFTFVDKGDSMADGLLAFAVGAVVAIALVSIGRPRSEP